MTYRHRYQLQRVLERLSVKLKHNDTRRIDVPGNGRSSHSCLYLTLEASGIAQQEKSARSEWVT